MQLKNLTLLIFLVLFSMVGYPQDTLPLRDTLSFNYDTTYLKPFPRRLYVSIPISSRYMRFGIYDKLTDKTMEFRPNQTISLGLNLSYRWFSIGFSANLPFLNNDVDKYGTTEKFDFVTNVYSRKYLLDANVSYYKGYYIRNPKELGPWLEIGYPKRPDIETVSLGLGFNYLLNHKKFSYRATFSQTEIQKRNAGSMLIGLHYSLFVMEADTSIILDPFRNSFGEYAYFRSAVSSNLGVSVGYIHNWILKNNFYATVSFIGGLGLQSFSAEREESGIDTSSSKGALRFQSKIAFGYRNEEWYGGLAFIKDNYALSNSGNATLNYNLGVTKFFVGRRFDVSRKRSKNLEVRSVK